MEHGDVARLLNVADADVRHYVVNDNSVSVVLTDGVERVWTPEGVFAVNDCPQNRSLRPLPDELRTGLVSEDSISEEVLETPPAEEEPSPEEVPDGTADEVLSWVDGDPDRAALAIDAEGRREKPRSVLLGQLRKVSHE